jgi:hypothetical protein
LTALDGADNIKRHGNGDRADLASWLALSALLTATGNWLAGFHSA